VISGPKPFGAVEGAVCLPPHSVFSEVFLHSCICGARTKLWKALLQSDF